MSEFKLSSKFNIIDTIWFIIGLGYSLLGGSAVTAILYYISGKVMSSSVFNWCFGFFSLSFFTFFWKFLFLRHIQSKTSVKNGGSKAVNPDLENCK